MLLRKLKNKRLLREYKHGYNDAVEEKNIEIKNLRERHDKYITTCRVDIHREYEVRIEQLREENNRLQKTINNNRDLYAQIKTEEQAVKSTAQEIGDQFLGAVHDFGRGHQKIQYALDMVQKFGLVDIKKLEKLDKE